MEPYVHEDDNGNMLTIYSEGGRAGMTICGEAADDPLRVFPEDFAKIAEALAERCGLPSPVILQRSALREMLAVGPHGDELVGVDPSPAGSAGNAPGVMLAIGSQSVRLIGDEPLAVALALADAMREAAAEPDPAEVEELANAIRAGLHPAAERLGLRPNESDRIAAITALRWMNAKGKHA